MLSVENLDRVEGPFYLDILSSLMNTQQVAFKYLSFVSGDCIGQLTRLGHLNGLQLLWK
jgi:hypothetical protein